MDIVTLAAARKGSGGGASKEYVDEKVAALIDDATAAQNKTYSSAKVEEKVAGEEITTTATGSDLTLSTSSGNLNALTVYGKSEVVGGSIKSAGEGYAVVDLGTLSWSYIEARQIFFSEHVSTLQSTAPIYALCTNYTYNLTQDPLNELNNNEISCYAASQQLYAKNLNYSDASAFKSAMSGVLLCYQLADPTQNNAIAVKTDNGTGINGTMATFTTGTPLRGITGGARDVMTWDGVSGEATKNCGELDLGALDYVIPTGYTNMFIANIPTAKFINNQTYNALCSEYACNTAQGWQSISDKEFSIGAAIRVTNTPAIAIKDTGYNDATAFKSAMSGVKLVYPLKTPTTQNLTTTENNSIAGLRTFEPMTHAQNNAGATMTVEAYAGTANGKVVNELKQDVQSEISALKITQSATMTLTTAGWSNNAQVIAYAHDTAKRNVIDVDPSSVEEWASCGVLATAETASGITFTCKTVPTNALTFRVTSMEV